MNKTAVSTVALSMLFAFTAVLGVAEAMTVKDESMMKKDDAMMSSTSDTMMKKEDAMKPADSMAKKDEAMMMADSMMKKDGAMMSAPTSDLGFGSRGEGVVALQTFLVAKNLLVMPAGVAMGYFGPLTKAALMQYQTMSGVSSTGYYGPLTRGVMSMWMMKKDDAMTPADSMMKKDAMIPTTNDAMIKKDDAMMSSTSDTMMKKEDSMMKKSI